MESKLKYSVPLSWDAYWDSLEDIQVAERQARFRIYEAGLDNSPHLFFVHGGGYTALTWSIVALRLKDKFRLTALDLRGHGGTTTDNDSDLSSETLMEDVLSAIEAVKTREIEKRGDASPLVMVGHSMGGALVVKVAESKRVASLQGVVVIDVVEGTAIASLPYMKGVLDKRPASFESLESAVVWALNTKMCRNQEAACISVPSMLFEAEQGYSWRTPLAESEPYWEEWYKGLSEKFLGLSVPKLLCLAGTDRLDKTLTVGQMQGKFQLSLMPTAGHAIQEDDPDRVSEVLTSFVNKFRIGQPLLPFLKK